MAAYGGLVFWKQSPRRSDFNPTMASVISVAHGLLALGFGVDVGGSS